MLCVRPDCSLRQSRLTTHAWTAPISNGQALSFWFSTFRAPFMFARLFSKFRLSPPAAACAALVSLLWLTGCQDASDTRAKGTSGAPAAAASIPVSVKTVAAEGVGFSAGSSMAANTVYVFFDPQCSHCNELWKAARPLTSRARFVWMPVGLLNDNSRIQGAALLAASDSVAAMDAHEASMQARTGGIAAVTGADKQFKAVAANTALLTRLGFTSIPTLVATHAKTGALVTHEGSLSTPALANLLGLTLAAAGPGS